jgi:hypothetical protein
MLYMKNVLESLGLKVKLPAVLEMDNQGAVFLANNWSIGGMTRRKPLTTVLYNCTFGAPNKGQMLDVCQGPD